MKNYSWPFLFLGGPMHGCVISVRADLYSWTYADHTAHPGIPKHIYQRRTVVCDDAKVDVFHFGYHDPCPLSDDDMQRIREFLRVPPFLLPGAPAAKPSSAQLVAALLAYDAALPTGAFRPPLAQHFEALRAAIAAAMGEN